MDVQVYHRISEKELAVANIIKLNDAAEAERSG
jgi:hypothetical protein